MTPPTLKSIALTAMMALPYAQNVVAQDDDNIIDAHLNYEHQCSTYGTDEAICNNEFRFDINADPSIFTFRLKGSTNETALDTSPSTLEELSFGVQNSWIKIDGGLLDVSSPVLDHLYQPNRQYMAPIALGNGLRRHKNFGDQVGGRIQLDIPLSSKWSLLVGASQTKALSKAVTHNFRSSENTDRLLNYNGININKTRGQIDEYLSSLKDTLDVRSSSDLINLIRNRDDLLPNFPDQDIRGKIETVSLYSWIYLEHSNGRKKIQESIDKEKLANDINDIRDQYINAVNDINVPDNLEQRLLDTLDRYISTNDISLAVAALNDAIPGLKEDLLDVAGEPITAQYIEDFIDRKLDDLVDSIEDDMRENPRAYHDRLKGNFDEIALIHKEYQDNLLFAHVGLQYSGENHNIQIGITGHEITTYSDQLVTEKGAELYAIWKWQITDRLESESILSVNGKENSLGVEGYYSAYVLLHQRFNYQFQPSTTGYFSFGGSAQERDGAVVSIGTGVQHCEMNNKLCLNASYEKTYSHDFVTNKYSEFGLDTLKGDSWRIGLSYHY